MRPTIAAYLAFVIPLAGVVGQTLTVPGAGADGPVTGSLGPTATGARLVLYASDDGGGWWGPKPNPNAILLIGAGGDFSVPSFAEDPNDRLAPSIAAFAVPGFSAPVLQGTGLESLKAVALAYVVVDRSGTVLESSSSGSGGGTAPVPPAPVVPPVPVPPSGGTDTGIRSLVITSPGAVGGVDAITGRVTNAPPGTTIVVYVQEPGGMGWWGAKPAAGSGFPVNADGTFTISGWTSAASDSAVTTLQLYAIPAGSAIPTVLGGNLPASLGIAAIASAQVARTPGAAGAGGGGTTGGGGVIPPAPPAPVPVTPPSGSTSGELPWPPAGAPTPGNRVNNGRDLPIPGFSGATCILKDTGGGTWGPGPNVFVGNDQFIWSDGWGIHLNVAPRSGCTGWASSECLFSRPLGYGTYVFRVVGPLEHQDPEVTYGLFTWDDGCPGDCWFREIDFEVGRWGNRGDRNSLQYVVQPWTRPGNLVRVPLTQARSYGGEQGPDGGGGCNTPGADNFNGALTNRVTLVLQWYPRQVRWFTFDGLWTLAGIQSGQAPLLTSLEYFDPASVFTPGDERVHLNLWQANTGTPGWGRRVHQIMAGFEYQSSYIDFPATGYPLNRQLLATGQFLEEHRFDVLSPAIAETLGLTRTEEATLVGIIKRHVLEAAESGEVDPAAVRAAWNDTAFVEWLEAFPLLRTGEPLGARAGETGKSLLAAGRRLLSRAAERLRSGQHLEGRAGPPHGTRSLQIAPAVVGPGQTFSCGDPRGMNDPARWAPPFTATSASTGQPSMAEVYGTTFAQTLGLGAVHVPSQDEAVAASGGAAGAAVTTAPSPPSTSGGTSTGAIIGAAVGGGLLATVVMVGVGMLVNRRASAARTRATGGGGGAQPGVGAATLESKPEEEAPARPRRRPSREEGEGEASSERGPGTKRSSAVRPA